MTPQVLVAALYKFADLDDYREMREPLQAFCRQRGVFGSLLLAKEGINGTIAGPDEAVAAVVEHLRSDPRLGDIGIKTSRADRMPFKRMKVRLKREIVSLGVADVDPNKSVGSYVAPQDWNALIADPDVVLIDTRNAYEVAFGSFEGAVDPATRSFREFPDWVRNAPELAGKRKVAMFCTGGIRCEKASSYLLSQGFEDVYHLQGGILNYLEKVPEKDSRWSGTCFVFDERIAVDHALNPTWGEGAPESAKGILPKEVALMIDENRGE